MSWPRVRLGDVLQHVPRPVSVEPTAEYREIGIRSHGRGIFHKDAVTGASLGGKKVFWLEPGDFVLNIVFAWEGAVGIVGPAEAGMIGSHRFPTFRGHERRLNLRFLLHYFRTREGLESLLRVSPGGAGRNRTLSKKAFLELRIPLPPLDEQATQVAKLERLEAGLRRAHELRTEADAALEAVWLRAAEERLERIGTRRPLGELVTVQGGGTPSKANPTYWTGPLPWVSPKDMKHWHIVDSEDHVSQSAVEETSAKLVKAGAVLVVTRGMILVRDVPVGLLRVDSAINQDMKALRPKPGVTPEYLTVALRGLNRGLRVLVAKSTHDTRKLETDKLLAFEVPTPSEAEQATIVQTLEALRDTLGHAESRAAAARADLEILSKAVLARAFAPARLVALE